MRIFAHRIVMSSLVLALAACATAAPYQPARNGVGYSEQRLESNRYKISFSGNASTPRETVENYLLYRSAEVTLNNGGDYFVLVDQATDAQTSYSQTFSGGFGSYYWYPYAGPGFGVNSGTSVPRTEYQAQANILVFKGAKPADNPRAFDARDVKSNLEATIVRPTPKS